MSQTSTVLIVEDIPTLGDILARIVNQYTRRYGRSP